MPISTPKAPEPSLSGALRIFVTKCGLGRKMLLLKSLFPNLRPKIQSKPEFGYPGKKDAVRYHCLHHYRIIRHMQLGSKRQLVRELPVVYPANLRLAHCHMLIRDIIHTPYSKFLSISLQNLHPSFTGIHVKEII